jgi:SAM-dependent methyltransferase
MLVEHCRLCGSSQLTPFLDLGFTALADRFITREQLDEPEVTYPLTVQVCQDCGFVHLRHVVPPEVLYCEDYPYESSTTRTGRDHFNEFAESMVDQLGLTGDDLAVDVGSNVGVLLDGFRRRGVRVMGVEPAANIAATAVAGGISTVNEFFSTEVARRIREEHGPARVVTASNVFAHIDDKRAVMEALDALLTDDGVFVIEAPYLLHLLDQLEYDTIYHEHLSYISLAPLVPFFERTGFELFDVHHRTIHGGTVRLVIARNGARQVTEAVRESLACEEAKGIHSLEGLRSFALRVEANRAALMDLLRSLKSRGKRIAAVSAPAKGMTLLNYCRIGDDLLEFVTEKSRLKLGRYTPGSHLPVRPDSALVEEGIDYALLLAWNFKEEIIRNLPEFREAGGRFIIPIPHPEII